MTAKDFLDLSTKLFGDMKAWIGEAAIRRLILQCSVRQ